MNIVNILVKTDIHEKNETVMVFYFDKERKLWLNKIDNDHYNLLIRVLGGEVMEQNCVPYWKNLKFYGDILNSEDEYNFCNKYYNGKIDNVSHIYYKINLDDFDTGVLYISYRNCNDDCGSVYLNFNFEKYLEKNFPNIQKRIVTKLKKTSVDINTLDCEIGDNLEHFQIRDPKIYANKSICQKNK
jgi:hypothetical protein